MDLREDESYYDVLSEMPENINKFVVLDVETTGLSDYDHIIQIGCYLSINETL